MVKQTLRPAIAMIELIFAIVVIGITLLSAPLILNQSIQSSHTSLQQESIAAAATQINLILTQQWDENDTNATGGNGILRVSAISSDPELNSASRDTNYTRVYNAAGLFANASSQLGPDANDLDDIDDFNGTSRRLSLYYTENIVRGKKEGEYIDQNITMSNTIRYGDDNANYFTNPGALAFNNPFRSTANTSNIKLITVTLTTNNLDTEVSKTISLSAFSCNIGASRIIPLTNSRTMF